jgi:hypothetical protein
MVSKQFIEKKVSDFFDNASKVVKLVLDSKVEEYKEVGKKFVTDFISDVENESRGEQEKPITDSEREEIARQIGEGNTSGVFQSDDFRISWDLKINKFR